MAYTTPMIEKIADYTDATNDYWHGYLLDFLGGRLFVL